MTDQPMSDPQPERQPSQQPQQAGGGMMAGMSQAEKILGLGALAIVLDWFIFVFIQGYYGFDRYIVVAAVYAMGVLWLNAAGRAAAWPVSASSQLRVVGYLVVIAVVIEFLRDIDFNLFDQAGGFIAGAFILYAGAALMGWGAKNLGG